MAIVVYLKGKFNMRGNAFLQHGRKPIMPRKSGVVGRKDGPPGTVCVHCGRLMNNFIGGSSKIPGVGPTCHPNVTGRPDCYHLVTLYKHKTPCEHSVCYEDHDDQAVYQKAGNEN